jgi:hypothetical protein
MAFSDFEIYTGKGTIAFENTDGAAILHNTLSSPLTGGGTYCRRIRPSPIAQFNGGAVLASIGTTVAGGAFNGPNQTKSQSFRCNMRFGGVLVAGVGSNIGLATRYTHTGEPSDTFGEYHSGYGFRFGTITNTTAGDGIIRVGLWARNGANRFELSFDNNPVTSAPWQSDTWYRFRLDVIPTGTIADEIRIFVLNGAEAEGNYVLIGSKVIVNGFDNFYIPFAANQRSGFYIAQSTFSANGAYNPQPFIDNFEARSSNIA